VAGDGSVVVLGDFVGTIDLGGAMLTSAGDEDIFLVRYAADGTLVHAQRFGGADRDYGGGLAIDGAGNAVLGGSCLGDAIDLGDGAVSCTALPQNQFGTAFVAKIEPDGDLIWKVGPSDELAWPSRLAVDGNGDVVMAGNCAGTCDLGGGPLPGLGARDIALARYAPSGAHVWSKRFVDINDMQSVTDLDVSASGAIRIVGGFGVFGDASIDFGGGKLIAEGATADAYDGFAASFDAAGNHAWSKRFGNAGTSLVLGAVDDGSGGLVVGGYFDGTIDFGGGPASVPNTGGFVVRLDAAGAHVSTHALAATEVLAVYGVAPRPSGGVHVGGGFSGTADLGGGPLVSAGPDAFVGSFDAAGQLVASRRFGDGCDQYASRLRTAAGGNVVVAGLLDGSGSSADFGNGPLVSAGNDDVFVAVLPP
jgi:hypothetical protein